MSYRNQKDADQARLNHLEEEIARLKKENEELKTPKLEKKEKPPPPPNNGIPLGGVNLWKLTAHKHTTETSNRKEGAEPFVVVGMFIMFIIIVQTILYFSQ